MTAAGRIHCAALAGLVAAALAGCVSSTPSTPQRKKSIVAMEFVRFDARTLADTLAGFAHRCWIGKNPAFNGLAFEGVQETAEAGTFRLVFKDELKDKPAAPRHLLILTTAKPGEAYVIVEQEGVDVKDIIGREAGLLLSPRNAMFAGRPAGC